MKKIAIFLSMVLFLIAMNSYAQKSTRTSAYFYSKNGQLDKAKVEIDKAILNSKTMNDAKTWLYRGIIYYGIATSPLPAYKNLDTNAAVKALQSLEKAKELDVKKRFKEDIHLNLSNMTNVFYKIGADGFNTKNYDKSIQAFKYACRVAQDLGRFDTVAAFNVGMSAVLAKKADVASKYLKECIDKDFADPRLYMFYSRSLKQLGDTTGAMNALQLGRKRFPDNLKLLLEEAQTYLEKGESDKLIVSLKEAITKDPKSPNNANFNFLIGKSYDDEGKSDTAEVYYKKAIKINPKFFEVYYNIGAIYVNKASDFQKTANDLPLEETGKYKILNDKANNALKMALPWLEKAYELHPKDEPTMRALKEAYIRLKMNDKLKAMNQK